MFTIGNKSAWYELGFDPERGIIVRIYPTAWAEVVGLIKPTSPILGILQKELSIPLFIFPSEDKWGFGPTFQKQEEDSDWKKFVCPLSSQTDFYAVSAGFNVIFMALSLVKEIEELERFQLLTIEGMGARKGHLSGWGISASISPSLCRWITKGLSVEQRLVVIDSMRFVHSLSYSERANRSFERSFRFDIHRPPFFHLSCPGNACALDPNQYNVERTEDGYNFGPHNVDNPIQQIAFLAGLAAIYQSARKDGF